MKKHTIFLYCVVETLIHMTLALLIGWFATIAHPYFATFSIVVVVGFCVVIAVLNYSLRTGGFKFFSMEEDL